MRKLPKIVLMIEPIGEYVQGILRGVVQYANLRGPWVFYRHPGKHEGTLPQLDLRQADGIIARVPNTPKSLSKLPDDVPAITIGYRKIIPGLPQILGDTVCIGKIAADYFLDKGFKKFAFCGFDEMHWSRERGEAFAQTIKNRGFGVNIYKNLKGPRRKSWAIEQQSIAKWLKSLERPTAILACNDDRGQHVLSACKLTKLRVPDDIAVLGVDNDKFVCGLSHPPLSSIALSSEKAGYESAELLGRLMRRKNISDAVIMVRPTHIVTRQSTDMLAIEDIQLVEAINFIHKHADTIISVEDIVGSLTVPRRTLERKFRKILNRSINDEIRRTRINYIIEMLLGTDLTITQIGLALGYNDLTHIARYFKEETGITPLAYRDKFGPKYK